MDKRRLNHLVGLLMKFELDLQPLSVAKEY